MPMYWCKNNLNLCCALRDAKCRARVLIVLHDTGRFTIDVSVGWILGYCEIKGPVKCLDNFYSYCKYNCYSYNGVHCRTKSTASLVSRHPVTPCVGHVFPTLSQYQLNHVEKWSNWLRRTFISPLVVRPILMRCDYSTNRNNMQEWAIFSCGVKNVERPLLLPSFHKIVAPWHWKSIEFAKWASVASSSHLLPLHTACLHAPQYQ